MDIRFQNTSGGEWRAACTLVFLPENSTLEACSPALLNQAPWLGISPALLDVKGKKNEQTTLYGHPDLALPKVLACGLGPEKKLNMQAFRLAVAAAAQACRKKGYETLAIPAENAAFVATLLGTTRLAVLKEAVTAALLGLYRSTAFKSTPKAEAPEDKDPRTLSILFTEKETPDADHRAVREGEAEAAGVLFARDLSNAPANALTPASMAEKATCMANRHGFTCTVLDEEEIQRLGMGALWAVGRGSALPPRFIVLEHCPKGKENDAPIVLVGKGITFDTGGISLKPAANMHEMKGDMGGAGAVLGFFEALGHMPASEELPRVIGLVPTAENMPGSHATRPGDIVTTLSGKTVEILNTDAEGRLILCDALTYAQQQWKPKALINAATLTGACVIALGDLGTAVFTKEGRLRGTILDAAERTGDLVWPLPLWDEYDANLDSEIADIANIGPREGGALHAALFLQRFIEEGTRWAHLDIAGPGYVVKKTALHPVPGGTGMGVRLFCQLIRTL